VSLNAVIRRVLGPIFGGWELTPRRVPPPGACQEAARKPGGWIYAMGGGLNPAGALRPEAIEGGWKVSDDGKIVGGFIRNPKYDPRACLL